MTIECSRCGGNHMRSECPTLGVAQSLETRIREYAADLRKNASGGDDYPWAFAKGVADYLEVLIGRTGVAQTMPSDFIVTTDYTKPRQGSTALEATPIITQNLRWNAAFGAQGNLQEQAADEIDRLRSALRAILNDINEYERVNNLSPNPGRAECWDSVAHAKALLSSVSSTTNEPAQSTAAVWRYKCHDGQFVYMEKRLTDEQKARGYYPDELDDEDDGESGPFQWSDETPLYSVSSTDRAPATLGGQIAAIYGEFDAEDCAWIDREWIKWRGAGTITYALSSNETHESNKP